MFSALGRPLAEITTNIAGPEHLGSFSIRIWQKMTKSDQASMSKFWGLLFFREKNAGGHLGWKPRVLCTIHCWLGLLAWPWLAWLSSPRTGLARLACTTQQQRRAPSATAQRFAPRSLLPVQAKRARPVQGEDSQASQGQASKPSQ